MAQNTSADVSGSALTPHPADRSIMQEPKFSDGCDIAYLFSEPLVQQIGTSLQPIQKLDLEKERALLENVFSESRQEVRLETQCATVDNMRSVITRGCRALHYTGHGLPDVLAFEDDNGAMHALDSSRLRELVAAGGTLQRVEFVCVCACFSEAAGKAFVDAGVPHVIAVRKTDQLMDKSAHIFLRHLYQALLAHHTVAKAFDIASSAVRSAAHVARLDEAKKFLLLPEDGNHNVPILQHVKQGSWIDKTPTLPPNNLPAQAENFIGRAPEEYHILREFERKRLIMVTGEEGIGKTQLAIAASRYLCHRRRCAAAWFIPLSQVTLPVENDFVPTKGSSWSEPNCLGAVCAANMRLEVACRSNDDFFAHMHKHHATSRILFVLDGVDQFCRLPTNSPWNVLSFIRGLLQCGTGLRILATCSFPFALANDFVPLNVPLGPLSPIEAARLFHGLAPRQIALSEFGYNGSDMQEAAQRLSRHRAVQSLAGNPKRIFEAVQHLTKDVTLDKLPEELERVRISHDQDHKQAAARAAVESTSLGRHGHGLTHGAPSVATGPLSRGGSFGSNAGLSTVPLVHSHSQPFVPGHLGHGNGNSGRLSVDAATPLPHRAGGPFGQMFPAGGHVSASGLPHHGPGHAFSATYPGPEMSHNAAGILSPPHGHHRPMSHHFDSSQVDPDHLPDGPPMPRPASKTPPLTPGGRIADGAAASSAADADAMASPNSAVRVGVSDPRLESRMAQLNIDESGKQFWRNTARGQLHVPWDTCANALADHFLQVTNAQSRRLSDEDMAAIRAMLLSADSTTVGLEKFALFWVFFASLENFVNKVRHLWLMQQPRLIYGLMSRDRAKALLTDRPPGTFALRFSSSNPGHLAVSYVDGKRIVQHTLIKYSDQGFSIDLDIGHTSFATLEDLITHCLLLTTLYPDVPKEHVLRDEPA